MLDSRPDDVGTEMLMSDLGTHSMVLIYGTGTAYLT